jgi:AAA+ ATPase superfamily predicted ATPase
MHKFIGRTWELEGLKTLLQQERASLVVVKGRRRIGKSRLIEEFATGYNFIEIAGLAPVKGVTRKHQRDEFARELARAFHVPAPFSADWSDLFWHLGHHTAKGRHIILLDEISWMGMKDPTFLGKLKNAWDKYLKKNPKLILVLCSSVSMWVEKNILSSTGFVGRIDLALSLDELSLPECNAFWGARKEQISSFEKFKILSVTGGVPRYLEIISPNETAEVNIKRLCFIKEGILFQEFDKIFHDLFGKKSDIYKKILMCLVENPSATSEDIFNYLNMTKGGTLTKYFLDLIQAGFVQKDYAWSFKDGRELKFKHYRISDNYIRFYLKYLLPNKNKIEQNAFANRSLSTLLGWDTVMGLQFENLVLKNRVLISKFLNIDPNEIINDNPYCQRGTKARQGCQIDYMIQTRYNCLYVCEIKFSKSPITVKVVEEMKSKISRLILPRNFSYRPILIHVNGVDDEVIAEDFFAKIIDFSELLDARDS